MEEQTTNKTESPTRLNYNAPKKTAKLKLLALWLQLSNLFRNRKRGIMFEPPVVRVNDHGGVHISGGSGDALGVANGLEITDDGEVYFVGHLILKGLSLTHPAPTGSKPYPFP